VFKKGKECSSDTKLGLKPAMDLVGELFGEDYALRSEYAYLLDDVVADMEELELYLDAALDETEFVA
jgi:hypothetical protein